MDKFLIVIEKLPKFCFEGVFIGFLLGALILVMDFVRRKKAKPELLLYLDAPPGSRSFLYFCLAATLLMIAWRGGLGANSSRYYIGLLLPFIFLTLVVYRVRLTTPIPPFWRRIIPSGLLILLLLSSVIVSLRFHNELPFFKEMGKRTEQVLSGARRPVMIANQSHEERILYYAGNDLFHAARRAQKVGDLNIRLAEALLQGDKITVVVDQPSQFEHLINDQYPQIHYRKIVTLPFRKKSSKTLYFIDNSNNPAWGKPFADPWRKLPEGYRIVRKCDFESSQTLFFADNKRFSKMGKSGSYVFFAEWPLWSATSHDFEMGPRACSGRTIVGNGSLRVKSSGTLQLKPFVLAAGKSYYCRYLYSGEEDAILNIKMRVAGERDRIIFSSAIIDAKSAREAEFFFDTPTSAGDIELIFEFFGGEMLLDNYMLAQSPPSTPTRLTNPMENKQ